MKRMIHTLLAAAVLVSAMTCTAFATEEEQPTTNIDGIVECTNDTVGEEVYIATYTNATAGSQYVVLVVAGDGEEFDPQSVTDANNIKYIDQKQAVNGTIEFTIKPSEVADSFVVLGGGVAPVTLGKINKLEPDVVYGDLTGDGEVKSTDVRRALLITLDKYTPTPEQLKAADLNGDGKVKANEVRRILLFSLDKLDSLP